MKGTCVRGCATPGGGGKRPCALATLAGWYAPRITVGQSCAIYAANGAAAAVRWWLAWLSARATLRKRLWAMRRRVAEAVPIKTACQSIGRNINRLLFDLSAKRGF